MAMAFIRKVPTKSGATAVQIIYNKCGQITHIDHIGSADNPKELDILIALAEQRLLDNQLSIILPFSLPNIFIVKSFRACSRGAFGQKVLDVAAAS